MRILHGLWIPQEKGDFIQQGDFYLWVESAEPRSEKLSPPYHPDSLREKELAAFLQDELGLKLLPRGAIQPRSVLLPSRGGKPLPSPESAHYLGEELPEEACALARWRVDGYRLDDPLQNLSDIHFRAFYSAADTQPGRDFLFWFHYSQTLKQLLFNDQYIPSLIYRQLNSKPERFEIYTGWQWASEHYERALQKALIAMPAACAAGGEAASEAAVLYDKESLLRHFSEVQLQRAIQRTPLPAVWEKKIAGTLLEACLHPPLAPWRDLERYRQWLGWRRQLTGAHEAAAFQLGLQLHDAPPAEPDHWFMEFLAIAKHDPSLKVSLKRYWDMSPSMKDTLRKPFGEDFERQWLFNLGHAARMYPKLWEGLETDRPVGLRLSLEEAFRFLKEHAWVLEEAGYKVIVPAWWTPKGRLRAKIRLRAAGGQSASGSGVGKTYLSLDNLVQYRYQLAIGDQPVTEEEWRELVNAKTPLIQFRGQWMELDRAQMQQMLEFWQKHGEEAPAMSVQELLKKTAEESAIFEIERGDALAEMFAKLHDSSRLEPIGNPPRLQGALREYQQRGVAWLRYLERLGLNGCLADDMGLGKTVQVIAHLVVERAACKEIPPTLLIAPTSVIGNWQKEIEKFAPHLKALVHHGSERLQENNAFKEACSKHALVITSYTLARKDHKLLGGMPWRRVVLDEAQNIKNPKAAQTKAIVNLQAAHRLALTGTPVENRLLDLWSIFNFLNPAYLGKQAQFRNSFEIPIQRDNDPVKSATLKRLVEPFILRRVKTDPRIIKDLPAKIENKQYCNLSREQASLYEAVVKEVAEQLEDSEGIARQGLMLSTLMKLKQICNHPMQFLQDGSAFTPERSHKLERLTEMLEEVMAEGDSCLIFTQFRELGEKLDRYLKQALHYNAYFLHGGTGRSQRERMIAAFQDPETGPSVFILSLKAGGVGITLTKANHVFHFDRWWNPAVEDQATDRAFRIGQKKNVLVHKFVTLGTLEERIDQMIEDKKQIAGAIVGADEAWLTRLDNERFKELIALNRQTVME